MFENQLSMNCKKAIFLLVILFIAVPLFAQKNKPLSELRRNFKFSALSFHVGAYVPSLAFWNKRYNDEYSSWKLNGEVMGGPLIGGTLDFHIASNFHVRGGLDFFTRSFQVNDTELFIPIIHRGQFADEDVTILALQGSFIAFYELPIFDFIRPYAGIGIGIANHTARVTSSIVNDGEPFTTSGQPKYAIGVGGINYMITDAIDVGVEGRLNYWGKYNMEEQYRFHKNSVAGPSLLIKIAYRLDTMYNRDRLGPKRRVIKSRKWN